MQRDLRGDFGWSRVRTAAGINWSLRAEPFKDKEIELFFAYFHIFF